MGNSFDAFDTTLPFAAVSEITEDCCPKTPLPNVPGLLIAWAKAQGFDAEGEVWRSPPEKRRTYDSRKDVLSWWAMRSGGNMEIAISEIPMKRIGTGLPFYAVRVVDRADPQQWFIAWAEKAEPAL